MSEKPERLPVWRLLLESADGLKGVQTFTGHQPPPEVRHAIKYKSGPAPAEPHRVRRYVIKVIRVGSLEAEYQEMPE